MIFLPVDHRNELNLYTACSLKQHSIVRQVPPLWQVISPVFILLYNMLIVEAVSNQFFFVFGFCLTSN